MDAAEVGAGFNGGMIVLIVSRRKAIWKTIPVCEFLVLALAASRLLAVSVALELAPPPAIYASPNFHS